MILTAERYPGGGVNRPRGKTKQILAAGGRQAGTILAAGRSAVSDASRSVSARTCERRSEAKDHRRRSPRSRLCHRRC